MPATLLSSTHVAPTFRVQVGNVHQIAPGIRSFEFVSEDGTAFPKWEPGAHIDVHLPSGMIRQYSLCGDNDDPASYRIAVLELADGRGGSLEAHRALTSGAVLDLGKPRNDFALRDEPAYVFVAGGIGITPILSMIRKVARAGKPWRLVYGARTSEHFAFREELVLLATESWGVIDFVAQDTHGHMDLADIVRKSTGQGVYCCGPSPLMDALDAEMVSQGRAGALVVERFSPPAISSSAAADSFKVELSESGFTVEVDADTSILEAIRGAGIDVPSSCEMGICGTCETKVLSGVVEHHDSLLTDDERAAGDMMMICVSRSSSPKLVIER